MRRIGGRIEKVGPICSVTLMATQQRVDALKAARRPYPQPIGVQALIDTGASCSAVDPHVVASLGLKPIASLEVHTPSTGSGLAVLDQFDICFALHDPSPDLAPGSATALFNVQAMGTQLVHAGFMAIIGWDVLAHCRLECDGPSRAFTLHY